MWGPSTIKPSTQCLIDNSQGKSEHIYEPSLYDILENKNQSYVLRFGIPGLQQNEIHVQVLLPNVLKVSGTHKTKSSTLGYSLIHKESITTFSRSVKIDKAIDFKQAKTDIHDGTLEISIGIRR
ncbi:hypothetical protein BDC45DRAFT_553568 [Circinella umbellata]|nr:hypothetical protein BDC45DRAFT_553568 [Circinella umbellata]